MIKVAVVGYCGHAEKAIRESLHFPNVSFIGCAPGSTGVDMSACRDLIFSLYHVCIPIYDDYRKLIAEMHPDVVIVDNFYGEHAAVAIDALMHGCHVFCEKPVAADLQELTLLENAWKVSRREFAAMLDYRYNRAFYTAYTLVRNGAIGKVRLLNAQKSYKLGTRPDFMKSRRTCTGLIPWVGIHGIDWIRWISDKEFLTASAVSSRMENRAYEELEMTALCQYELENEVMASLSIDYFNPETAPLHGDDRIRVVGTDGVLEVASQKVSLINESADGIQYPQLEPEAYFFAEFLSQVSGQGQCRITAEDSFAATRIALISRDAADSGIKQTI